MHKILVLCRNEWAKFIRKGSVVVIGILLLIAAGATPILVKSIYGFSDSYSNSDTSWQAQDAKVQMGYIDTQIDQLEAQVKSLSASAGNESRIAGLKEKIESCKDNRDRYQFALDHDISYLYGNSFMTDILQNTMTIRSEMRQAEQAKAAGDTSSKTTEIIQSDEKILKEYESLRQTPDFSQYVKAQKEYYATNPNISEETSASQSDYLDFWIKIDPSGGSNSSIDPAALRNTFATLETLRRTCATRINPDTGSAATAEEMESAKNKLAVIEYRLEHQYFYSLSNVDSRYTAIDTAYGIGMFMVAVLLLILGGSSVSHEISTGSIKSLIISPVKRWKILTAKFFALSSLGLVLVLLLAVVGYVSTGLLYGFGGFAPYVFAKGGIAGSIPYLVYRVSSLLISYIDVLVYMIFAVMLSTLTRNTAVSVAAPIAIYFGGSLAITVMRTMEYSEFLNFVPFSNLNLASRVFPFSDLIQSTVNLNYMGDGMYHKPSLLFSVLYLLILSIGMLYATYDSFIRRDLK